MMPASSARSSSLWIEEEGAPRVAANACRVNVRSGCNKTSASKRNCISDRNSGSSAGVAVRITEKNIPEKRTTCKARRAESALSVRR